MEQLLTREGWRRPTLAAIAVGSNLRSEVGDREANLREAIRRLGAGAGSGETGRLGETESVGGLGRVVAVSTFHDTAPVGTTEQPRFLNGALLLETEMEPEELMRGLLRVEQAMGRVREPGVVNGPRVIDLDLVLYGDRVIATAELTLPHPGMHVRRFVLEPLAEIAPEMVHPVLGVTVGRLWEELRSQG